MQRIAAKSLQAAQAYELAVSLQTRLVERLQQVSVASGSGRNFECVEWLREDGRHGGGTRYTANDKSVFNQASVNVSQVQYDADDTKRLASATALSSIVHPHNPLAPSVHLHVSWTEMKAGTGYWRVMADLNPAIENPQHTMRFKEALTASALQRLDDSYLDDEQLTAGFEQGDRYFHIPALTRHRGVCHFYLENYFTENPAANMMLAERVIRDVIDIYATLLDDMVGEGLEANAEDFNLQLDYHSLYFFQVLTLDRGTTSGLLVHDQNDIGILGSLPHAVDKELISSWRSNMPEPQNQLLDALLDCLAPPKTGERRSVIDESVKKALANAVRRHYNANPHALALQASGEIIPPTVANHQPA